MAAVTAETASTSPGEDRRYSQVRTGYTPFLDGDLLVAKITPCFENGKIAQATLKHPVGFGSTEFHVVRSRPGRADARYLLHFLRQDRIRREGESTMTGSAGQRRVPERFLADLDVPLPLLSEQRRIAEVLDRAEALRAKRRAALAQLDTLTQSIFLDMFGDPVANPRRWPDPTLGGALHFIGYGPRFYDEPYSTEGTRIVRITDLSEDGVLDFSAMPRMEVSGADKEKHLLHPGDLIFARTGATVGKVALIRSNDPPCIAGAYFITLRFKETLEPLYARAVLTAPSVRAIVARRSRQAAQPNFSGPALRQLPMPLPPTRYQREFVSRIAGVETLRAAHRASLTQFDALFASLQHRAFRGEL